MAKVTQSEDFTVSVVIVTYNSENTIERCLHSLFRQSMISNQVVVVDGGSSDSTIRIVNEMKEKSPFPISVIIEAGKTRGRCRNVGLEHCSGNFVAFLDSDCEAPFDWINNIVTAFRNSEESIRGVGGPYVPPERSPVFSKTTYHLLGILTGKLTAQFLRREDQERLVDALPGGNCAFSREAMLEVSGFDSSMDLCEDTDVSHRLGSRGYKLKFTPTLFVHHDWRGWKGLLPLASAAFSYGKGRVVASRSKDSLSPYGNALLFSALVLGALLELTLPFVSPIYLLLPGITILGYLAFCSLLMMKHKAFSVKAFLSPVVFLASYGLGMLSGVSKSRRKVD
ncbi:MAG: glycosyltransferase [Nitrososphaerota archaeon]|nr:glycosyltransferase [Nitrososphaerota archaeon]